MKVVLRIFSPLLGILICFVSWIIAAGSYLYERYRVVEYTAYAYEESSRALNNPYQGFYRMLGYILTDGENSGIDNLERSLFLEGEYRLVLLEINLHRFADGPLSDTAIEQLDTILQAWSGEGRKLILRFVYDWDGRGLESEPAELEIILGHMDQVAPVVNRYTSSVYLTQGIFVGNYGEMNNSSYLYREAIITLLTHWAEITDPSVYLAVRTPAQWRIATGCVDLPQPFPAFSDGLIGRLGLYNDGMMGSESDLGTYGDVSRAGSDDPGSKGTREEELDFQNQLCRYAPNGGEVISNSVYTDLDNAIRNLTRMHISYLNDAYDPAAINKWKTSVYTGEDCFNGMSGYEYIKEHLGYRYVLRDSSLQFDTWKDEGANLSFSLENVGFASALREFSITVTWENVQTMENGELPVPADIRYLSGGETETYGLQIPIRDYEPGEYRFYLMVTDPATGAQIQFACEEDPGNYGYLLGSIVVDRYHFPFENE